MARELTLQQIDQDKRAQARAILNSILAEAWAPVSRRPYDNIFFRLGQAVNMMCTLEFHTDDDRRLLSELYLQLALVNEKMQNNATPFLLTRILHHSIPIL